MLSGGRRPVCSCLEGPRRLKLRARVSFMFQELPTLDRVTGERKVRPVGLHL